MRPLQGTTEVAASSCALAALVPASSGIRNSSSSALSLRQQKKLHQFVALSVTFSRNLAASGAGARASDASHHHRRVFQSVGSPVLNKLGTGAAGGGGGWLWRSSKPSLRVGSNFASRATGQLGFLMDAAKNSAVCQMCRTRLPTGSLACLSSTSFGGGGGRGIGGRGAGGGGGGGGDGFEARAGKGAAAVGGEQSDDLPVGSDSGEDVIILDVGGMSCGGCSASVKRILESQPQVSLANVNLATETAFVQITHDGQAQSDWVTVKEEIAEVLAKHLTSCGFKSTVRELVI